MKNLSAHIAALIVGLIVGNLLSGLFTQHAFDKQKSLKDRAHLLTRLGDINRLKEKGFNGAARMFEPDLYLRLGEVGNYYKKYHKTPTESEWIMIDPVLKYLRKNNRPDQFRSYPEASEGVEYLMHKPRSKRS
jgi:hypothetical protein